MPTLELDLCEQRAGAVASPEPRKATSNRSISAAERRLVQDSFSKVEPTAVAAVAMFYGKLFELDPNLRGLFKSDLMEQGQELIAVLRLAVKGLDDLPRLIPVVSDLGARLAGYGVRDRDYDRVAEALLWTLEQSLGDDFTPTVAGAWIKVYDTLAGVMANPARQAA